MMKKKVGIIGSGVSGLSASIRLSNMGYEVHVFEAITTENETNFEGTVKELEGREFSDLSVMVFNQTSLDSYMNYRWQWEN